MKKYLTDFVYPTPYELHYFHPNYLTDENYICGGEGFTDPDLAGHFVITDHRGIKLYGQELKSVFKPTENKYYIESIYNDIKVATKEIIGNPVCFSLNLCRVLYFLREAKISSKKEGGEWGIRNLSYEYQDIVKQCLEVYTGMRKVFNKNIGELADLSKWMINQCEQFM